MEKGDDIKSEGADLKKQKFEFNDLAEAEQYLDWKKAVPQEIRRLVEGEMLKHDLSSSQIGLSLKDQFLNILGKSLRQKKFVEQVGADDKVSNLLKPLEKIETKGGYLNVFEALLNASASWSLKKTIYETQIKPALEWLAEKDLEEIAKKIEGDWGKESSKKQESNDLPPDQDEAVSSMEVGKQERKEGEPPKALFSVSPFFGDYASDKEFDRLGENFRWKNTEEKELFKSESEQYALTEARVISGKARGGKILALPVYDNWTTDSDYLETDAPEGAAEILQDWRGKYYLKINAEGDFHYALRIAPRIYQRKEQKAKELDMSGKLPDDLLEEIQRLKNSRLPKMKLKREIVKFIRNHLKYSNSGEAWNFYTENEGREFFERVWRRKETDCFVANTMAARALAEIDRDIVLVGGYYVKEKDENGNAVMHGNNGHGWIKIWDDLSEKYLRLDATPKGDPNMDEEQQEKELEEDLSAGGGEGDFGEQEELASEEEIKKRIEEMRKKQPKKETRRVSQTDLEQARFAEMAECSPNQAREFLNALERVRLIKDENGNSISNLLKDEWKKIIIERKIEAIDYRGPVRMDEGDRLEDPVSARIDILSKEFNPTGFEKISREEKRETDFGGINIYFSFDLSGSMNKPDGASGRRKADVQRDVALLFADSLMQCAYVSRQQGENSDLLPIKIMVTLASRTGEVKLNLTDKWGPKEQWAFYYALNQTASGGTPTHTTLKLIEKDFDLEIADLKRKKIPKDKLPLNYVVEMSDGAPDDFLETEAMHEKLKSKGAAIRSYCIGGASASEDAAEPIESFSQLPQILSKDIIEKFASLNPRRIK